VRIGNDEEEADGPSRCSSPIPKVPLKAEGTLWQNPQPAQFTRKMWTVQLQTETTARRCCFSAAAMWRQPSKQEEKALLASWTWTATLPPVPAFKVVHYEPVTLNTTPAAVVVYSIHNVMVHSSAIKKFSPFLLLVLARIKENRSSCNEQPP
jgi:hypothetical protein